AVDPTVGHAIRLAGYDTDFASVPQQGEPLQLVAQPVPGWRAIRFSPATRTVLVPRGVELDLGATAKALAADLAAAAAWRAAGGGPPPSPLQAASTRTSHRPPPSSWARTPRPGSR